MSGNVTPADGGPAGPAESGASARRRRLRSDARRNVDALLEAAKEAFATAGVDAPAKRICELAGVGVGTLYRHFPQRADLVTAVFRREVDACAASAAELAAAYEPGAALERWLHRYTEFLAAKRGLAAALHRIDPEGTALSAYFRERFEPVLGSLLEAAAATGEIGGDVTARELLHAVANLCVPPPDESVGYSRRMVTLLVDGLRYRAAGDRDRS